jgi:hypothetical protein
MHGSLGITGASVAAATTEADDGGTDNVSTIAKVMQVLQLQLRTSAATASKATKCIVVHNSSLDTDTTIT